MWLAAGVAGLVGAALCLWLMHERSMPGLRALDKNFQCPDMRFRYSPEELFDGLDRLGAQGRALLLRFWCIDAGFVVSLLAVMLAAAHNCASDFVLQRSAMDAAACLRAAADLMENALLSRAVRAYPQKRLEGLVRLASTVTSIKWCLMVLWVAGLFASLFFRAIRL